MKFTYTQYERMVDLLRQKQFEFVKYSNYSKNSRCVILRHDIDYSLKKAVEFAEFEKELGISSTYMVLLSSDFYNVFSKEGTECVQKIIEFGHSIGLHFDEKKYENNDRGIEENIKEEIIIMNYLVGEKKIDSISMHRPSKTFLDMDLNLNEYGIKNSYNQEFFKEFKYVSDSRMEWREPIMDYIQSDRYEKYQILTHPFWYRDNEQDIETIIFDFIRSAKRERIDKFSLNFRDLENIVGKRREK